MRVTLIEAVRDAMTAFLEGVEQNDVIYATYTGESLRIDNTLINIPMEMVDLPKIYSPQGAEIELVPEGQAARKAVVRESFGPGDKVAVAVHHGGKRYSVLYKL